MLDILDIMSRLGSGDLSSSEEIDAVLNHYEIDFAELKFKMDEVIAVAVDADVDDARTLAVGIFILGLAYADTYRIESEVDVGKTN